MQNSSPEMTVDYKAKDPELIVDVPKFSLNYDPSPSSFQFDPNWTYQFFHPDQVTEVTDPSFFIQWTEALSDLAMGRIKIYSETNNRYFVDIS